MDGRIIQGNNMAYDDKTEQFTLTEDTTPDESLYNLSDDLLFAKLKCMYEQDIAHTILWRKKARKDRDFYDGHQWSQEDKQTLKSQQRPCITMNRIKVLVNAVTGSEINNRREVQYYPREIGDAIPSELLTSAGEWFRQQAKAEDEESIAFQDCVITGMGWVDTRLDFETSRDGSPVVQRLDPFKMVWDCSAERQNLEDAQRLWYVQDYSLGVAKRMFPGIDPAELSATWAIDGSDDHARGPGDIHDQTRARYYLGGQDEFNEGALDQKLVRIIECRYLELEDFYSFRNPMTGEWVDLETKEELDAIEQQLKSLFPEFNISDVSRHLNRKVVKRVFLGGRILEKTDSPATPDGMFGWECITGYYDNKHRHYHGLVRSLIDVQNWTNKFFSQVMHILNSQSKGGILAERGVFDNEREAQESLARADSITYVKPNMLSANKLIPKPAAQFPAGFWNLFSESKDELTQISGLSPEFIGTREVNQPGVLESQRRQSTLNLLASLFNALRRYRQNQGKIVLYLIQNYLSDGRLIRIVGQGKARYVPLIREQIADVEYDIIVDDAPTSPVEKEKTFAVIQQMLPMLQPYLQNSPSVMLDVLRYSPLPATLVENLAQTIEEEKRKAEEQQQQMMQQPQQPDPKTMEIEARTQLLQTDVAAKQQKAEIDTQSKMIDLQVKQFKAQLEAQANANKAMLDAQKLAIQEEKNRIAAARVSRQII